MDKLTNLKGRLLEGCIWDEKKQQLYFADIECRKIYCYQPDCKSISDMEMKSYVSCVVLKEDGTLLAALPDGLYHVDFEKKTAERVMNSALPEGIRYNDGKCAPDGSLWIGSMSVKQDENAAHAGALFCIKKEQIQTIYSGFTIPNGLAWEREEPYFYHVDTPTGNVYSYRITENGYLTEKKVAVDLQKEKGSPDGMCMDSQGKLWIAMWGGYQVICADPKTGEVLEHLPVEAENVSCCCFGGSNLDELYITTAQNEAGNGGELFVQKMNVTGGKVYRYGE
ncbi:MAG: SMP-30/gluconolactonase/LRE family protein [Muricoprocola sp.]